MLPIVKAGSAAEKELFFKLRQRGEETDKRVTETVSAIIADVRENGDSALRKYSEKFDRTTPDAFEIPREVIASAKEKCDPAFIRALTNAARNIADFHKLQLSRSFFNSDENGVMLGQRLRPLSRVGIYVPGGTAAYPSSVLMCAIPAKIAGVKEVIMVTPPFIGDSADAILAAADIAGVDRVFLTGGAQAVAALAYGTESIPRVDKIVGPGNIYVATAKRLLFGKVDIDMIAGPSEILVVADESANPACLAADLMSQAEHDRLASAILLTTSEKVAADTLIEIEKQLHSLSRREIIEDSLKNYCGAVIFDDIDSAIEMANFLAPEHLELCIRNPFEYIGRIDNAGSVFLGNYSPEPLGDYYAGPNHVLPTGGTARFFSPLGVDSFVKRVSFIYYTKDALESVSDDIITLARAEGLSAHANSIDIRRRK